MQSERPELLSPFGPAWPCRDLSYQDEQSSAAADRHRRHCVEDFSRPQERKSSTTLNHARRLPFVTGGAARDLVGVESSQFWRPDRDQIENRIVRVDPKAVWRMVVASDLHTARHHGILPGLIASFWRGEFVWHLQRMASTTADAFYALSSAIVILATGLLLLRRRSNPGDQRLIVAVALLSFLSVVAFLVALSISFDFGQCPYPSREHPYFTSGRLLDAAAVPFSYCSSTPLIGSAAGQNWQWLRWTLAASRWSRLFRNWRSTRRHFPAGRFLHRQTP